MRKRQAIWIFKSGRKERLESACDFPIIFTVFRTKRKWMDYWFTRRYRPWWHTIKPTAYLLNKLARFFGRIPIGLIAGLINKQVRESCLLILQ